VLPLLSGSLQAPGSSGGHFLLFGLTHSIV
jgi:hypothetical protein